MTPELILNDGLCSESHEVKPKLCDISLSGQRFTGSVHVQRLTAGNLCVYMYSGIRPFEFVANIIASVKKSVSLSLHLIPFVQNGGVTAPKNTSKTRKVNRAVWFSCDVMGRRLK